MGADLVKMKTEGENNFLRNSVSSVAPLYFWIEAKGLGHGGRLELAGYKFCEENILVPDGTKWWLRRELRGLGGSVPFPVRRNTLIFINNM